MLKGKWSKLTECLCRRHRLMLLFLPCILVVTLYIVSGVELEFDSFLSLRPYNPEDELVDGYLVWNSKCHMISKNPMDASITEFVKKEKFEGCSTELLMTYISRDPTNGTISLVIDPEVAKSHKNPVCCWASVVRPTPPQPPKGDWESKIRPQSDEEEENRLSLGNRQTQGKTIFVFLDDLRSQNGVQYIFCYQLGAGVGKCEDFEKRVILPQDVEMVMVNCLKGKTKVYENVHAVINPAKIQERLEVHSSNKLRRPRKLSVLVLGLDSVSRLNFKRSMPRTERFLRDTNWFHLRGYNKMGDNTFPNLMAILTGHGGGDSYSRCKPTVAYGLDQCPMLWYNYRNAGYTTAYGEDVIPLSTFNYHKVGFVDPPTDYYLRPYMLASEKLLKSKKRFGNKYCTGPEITVERIFNFATEFARTFLEVPYFGFFWTNSVSHDEMNGPSSMDNRLRDMFAGMEQDGIFADAMIVFLSDHGMRWGGIRNTFVGWYEERLPFIYIRLPEWFRAERPQAYQALRINENRLTSPYDLYETLRDVLISAGGEANSSSGCPTCQSLFRPVPLERGCGDAGVSPHWCTCTAFETGSVSDNIAVEGTKKFLDHVENIIKEYKDKNGKRLCSKLKLKKIHRVDKIIDIRRGSGVPNASFNGYFYLIEVTPGGGRYETTIKYHGGDNFTVSEDEISRVNSYASSSRCLDHGSKRYCHCVGK